MARPSAEVIKTIEDDRGSQYEVLAADAIYVLTYQGQPFGMRSERPTLNGSQYKYRKVAYQNLGNIKREVQRLNQIFATEDFAYVRVL